MKRDLGWEQRNWINSADPGDWEINHVFKKTGSFLVHFPFSFGERREGLLMGGAGVGMSLGCSTLSSGAQFPEAEGFFSCPAPPCLPKCLNPKGLEGHQTLQGDY